MQIYEKLILHVQIEHDFPQPAGRKANKYFFYNKLSKELTCFAFKIKCYCN